MKKYSYLQSSAKLSQLQARLNKNPYLSKGSLPTGADAKVFLFFQKMRKYPKRSTHPNLYHWYILMKQFSLRTVQIWQSQYVWCEQERFISQYIQFETVTASKENSQIENNLNKEADNKDKCVKNVNNVLTPKSSSKKNIYISNEQTQQPLFLRSVSVNSCSMKVLPGDGLQGGRVELNSPIFEVEYVMEMQLKGEREIPLHVLRERLQEQRLQLLSLQGEDGNVRVVFKAEAVEYQRLKDRISQWEQISNLQFRKQKRVNTRTDIKSEKYIMSPNGNGLTLAI